jgi:hypothetical protein
MQFGREPPAKMSIYRSYKLFSEAGYLSKGKSPGKRPIPEAKVNEV